ncbi:MAG TPA: 6-phosphogluconolactonase [Roseiarcus sp.]|nr:6-phosphogluconolactonase [Roseiarcus sp.]
MTENLRLVAPDGSIAEAIVYPDAPALVVAAAELIASRANEAISARGIFSIALSGGDTPKPVYARLALAKLDWSRVHIYFGDERCVPPDDPLSNYRMVKEALLDKIAIPPANVLRMRGEAPPDEAAQQYQQALRVGFGEDGRLDLVLLGLGDDGHTASLFPGLAAVTETVRWVATSYVEAVGRWRVSLTPPVINAARVVAFLVAGPSKAEVLRRVLLGPRQPVVLPAQAIRPTERPALWLLDEAAAARLDRPR